MELTGVFSQIKPEKVQGKKFADTQAARGEKTASVTADRVVLSSGSLEAQEMRAIIAQTPDVRADRVQMFKERIARGEYRVDPEELAGRMINDLLSGPGG